MARKRDQLAALTETSKTDPKTTVEYEKYLESKHKAERKYWAEQKANQNNMECYYRNRVTIANIEKLAEKKPETSEQLRIRMGK